MPSLLTWSLKRHEKYHRCCCIENITENNRKLLVLKTLQHYSDQTSCTENTLENIIKPLLLNTPHVILLDSWY